MKRPDYFSVRDEPALHPECCTKKAEPEQPPKEESDVPEEDRIRDSVFSEPGAVSPHTAYRDWLTAKSRCYTPGKILLATIAAGILGGLAAVPGVFLAGQWTFFQLIYLVGFGPLIEEIMKQAGMIYLLEKRPCSVQRGWQFVLASVIAAGIFATLENLLYQHLYLHSLKPDALSIVMVFRWRVCLCLHVSCAIIAGMGLRRAWLRHREQGRPVELSDAYGWFTTAIVLHGVYNLLAVIRVIDPLDAP